jgi:hypothetical protein
MTLKPQRSRLRGVALEQLAFIKTLADELVPCIDQIIGDAKVTGFKIGKTKDYDARKQRGPVVYTLHSEKANPALIGLLELELNQLYQDHPRYSGNKEDSSIRPVTPKAVHLYLMVWRE